MKEQLIDVPLSQSFLKLRIHLLQSSRVQCRGHAQRIVRGGPGSPQRVGDHEGRQPMLTIEVPEAIVAYESRASYRVIDQRKGARVQKTGGPVVILGRVDTAGLCLQGEADGYPRETCSCRDHI